MPGGGNSCAFRGCKSRSSGGISLFSFPRDPEQAELWLKACYRCDLLPKVQTIYSSGYKLCELHFEEKFISKGSSKKRLFANAIPSIFPTKMIVVTEKLLEENTPKDGEECPFLPEASQEIHIISAGTVMPEKIVTSSALISTNILSSLEMYGGPSTSKEVTCEPLNNIQVIEQQIDLL